MTDKSKGKMSKFYYFFVFILAVLSVVLIRNTLVDWIKKQVQEEWAAAEANSPTIKVIDQKALAVYFQTQGYDIPTQLEYMDILKILLERSHILAVNASAVQFDIESYNLRINSIDQLRLQLEKLGIENPRKANEEEYLRREATQKEIVSRLFGV
ncbi:hypothetical protein ACNPKZ_17450 [Shewanella algae]|uniref:hypothetical protein n=1 Tax=Shewanella TaxID=22 RepID=UPI000F42524B|nr:MULTISPECIES: hypothetical protein [Shewanella]AYV11422.1 hypothetical protein EEY24_00160 [Shewanella algae]